MIQLILSLFSNSQQKNNKMNERLQRELSSKIKNIDFGQHMVGYKYGQFQNERAEGLYTSSQQEQRRSSRRTQNITEKIRIDRHLRGSFNRNHTNDRERGINDDQNEDHQKQFDNEFFEESGFEEQPNNRHAEFIRSYQGWLKDTYVNGYQTARLPSSLGMKKSKASLKSSRKQQYPDMQFYQMQINQQYKQGNLFPCRPYQSVKKIKFVKQNSQTSSPSQQNPRYKGEGELKLKLMKSMAKKEVRGSQKRKNYTNLQGIKHTPRPQSALLRNFSNPKILSIENRQLVTGTNILLL